MKLSPAAFNRWLDNIGQRFAWRRALACPCINPHSKAPQPGCPLCRGKGRFWEPPVEGKSGIAGQKVQTSWAQFGVFEAGDVVLTIPSDSPLYAMGQFDRVVMLDSTQPFSVTLAPNESLRFPVKSIERVFWLAPDGTAADAAIPQVNEGGVPVWDDPADAPPAGVTFSVTGRQHPEYFVWGEFPQDRAHHGGRDLPRRVVLRRFDLFGK